MKNRLTAYVIAALLSLQLFAVDEELNPFQSYLDEISRIEAKLEKASDRKKEDYDKKLVVAQKKLEDAVAKQKKPYEEKIVKYEKALEKAKSKNVQKSYEDKIAENRAKIAEIDAWVAGKLPAASTPEKGK